MNVGSGVLRSYGGARGALIRSGRLQRRCDRRDSSVVKADMSQATPDLSRPHDLDVQVMGGLVLTPDVRCRATETAVGR